MITEGSWCQEEEAARPNSGKRKVEIVDKFYNLFIFFIKYRQQIETKMKKQGIKLYLDFNSLRNSAALNSARILENGV